MPHPLASPLRSLTRRKPSPIRTMAARTLIRWRTMRRRLVMVPMLVAVAALGRLSIGAEPRPAPSLKPSTAPSTADGVIDGAAAGSSTLLTEPPGPATGSEAGRFGTGADERMIALAPPLSPLPLEPGDLVELYGVRADLGADVAIVSPATGEPARVVYAEADAVVVIVPQPDVEAVLAHDAVGTLVLVATGERHQ
ncbi:MAG: hypothetical protein AAF467_22700 [Actinomycetota bacterium]